MSKLLFRLNGVDDDEANEVRQLLDDHNIPYYETHAGRWGLSVAAIWLIDEEDFEQARQLIEQYQIERSQWIQQQPIETFAQRIQRKPATFILVCVAICATLYITLAPFISYLLD